MANIFFGLNIGRSALIANQTAIDVTGHNLSNVQTEGYSRQRVSMIQGLPVATPRGSIGSGVNVERIQRLQVSYLERQAVKAKAQEGYNATLAQGLDELQNILGEPSSDGLGNALSELWSSWEALSANPADASLRAQVLDRADHLALVYNQKVEGFTSQEATLDDAIAGEVADVNAWGAQVASLNKSIGDAEVAGYGANDLRDQRDQLIEQMAKKLAVDTEADGSYINVRLPNGGPYLVQRTSTLEVATHQDAAGAVVGLLVGEIPVEPTGGSTAAFLELRNQVSPGLRGELSELAATVVDRLNALHASGYGRDGVSGRALFGWGGTADTTAFSPNQGVLQLSVDANVEAGTHVLEVATVNPALKANTAGTAPAGTLTLSQSGTFSGPASLNLDYHVRVLSANSAPADLAGLRVQLYRGDEAVGTAQALSGPGPAVVNWGVVDGIAFSSQVDLASFSAGMRSDGLATTGTVTLDGGAPLPVDLTTQNNLTFAGGSKLGFSGGGTVQVNFDGSAFSGASFTRYSSSSLLFVNPEVAADTNKLAAAATAATTGDGERARQMADLAAQQIFEQLGETPAGFLGRTVQAIGARGRDAQVFEKASATISAQLLTQKQATSGVNTDEEMVNLIQYQRGFEAAARFLSTVDGLLDTLLNKL